MLMGAAGQSLSGGSGHQVDNGAMFNDGSSQYLLRTPSTAATSDKINTVSFWFKRGTLGTTYRLLNGRNSGGTGAYQLGIGSDDKFNFHPSITTAGEMNSTMVFRDPHAWYHVVASLDTTQSTEADRYGFWVNGVDMRSNLSGAKPAQNLTVKLNENGVNQVIAAYQDSAFSNYWDGYLAEFVVIDGSKLDADQFGEFDSNGVWRPIDVSGLTFGNNGYYLPFTNSAGLGQDYSGSSSTTVVQKNTYNAGSEINEGDSSANPSTGMKFVPIASGTVSKIELNASSRGFSGVTVRLETDGGSGNSPSGTLVTNGEVTGITSSGSGLKTATFSTPPEVTAGVTYWIVLRGDTGTWGWQQDVAGSGGALGLYQGALGYFSGRGVGHYVYMTGNHFTPVNSPTQSTDTCTDNHANWSPLISYKNVSLSEGNTRSTTQTSSGDVGSLVSGFELPTSGKYYWEWVTNDVGSTPALGWRDIATWDPAGYTSSVTDQAQFITGTDWATGSGRILSSTIDGSTSLSQQPYGNFSTVSGGNPLQNGTVLGCAYDADNGLAWFSYNNSWIDGNGTDNSATVKGEIEAGTSGSQAFTTANGAVGNAGLFITAGVNAISTGDFTLRSGSWLWTGDCPTGFTALSTKNQAEAVTYNIEDGSAHHQTTLYTGSGNSQSITQDSTANNNFAKNSTFKPDLLWLRGRETYPPNSSLYDVQHSDSTNPNRLTPNLNSAAHDDNESSANKAFESFDVKGFSFQGGGNNSAPNASSKTMTAWQWLADNTTGSTSGFTQGSLTSTVSKNQTAGFSIVTWTGNGGSGGAQTIGHGLGRKPNMIWVKNRTDAENWVVYHDDIGFNAGTLNSDAARITTGASVYWNDTAFTENVFTVNTHNGVNGSGDSMVAYCFASIPGYSKFSAYIGNNSTNGPYIDLGFKPAWIMIKAITTVESWWIGDNARYGYNDLNRPMLAADLAADATNGDEETGWSNNPPWDALSNGFKIRRQGGAFNTDGNSYLYAAFASNPFAGPTPNTAR